MRALAALALLGVLVTAIAGQSYQQLEKELEEESAAFDQYVDAGIELCVLERDDAGESLLADSDDRFRITATYQFGGIIDTTAQPPCWWGPTANPVRWYCSRDQLEVLLHDPIADAPGQIVYGGEGAGKSTVSALWFALRCWLPHLGQDREFGCVAPTEERTEFIRDEAFKLYPASWYRWRASESLLTFCDGTRIQFLGSKKQSAAIGSKLQGLNWSGGVIEEMQDHEAGAVENARSRMRSGRGGKPPMLGTCTAKQSPAFQRLRDKLIASQLFERRDMLTENSPFIPPQFLIDTAKMMSAEEFNRRFKAIDPPKDGLIYKNFDRRRHLRPIPTDARRITSIVLGKLFGTREGGWIRAMLGGNDPGAAKAASVLLDAYEIRGIPDPVWWVRAELFTRHKTTEQHAHELMKLARNFGLNHPKRAEILHLRSQPVGQSDGKPDESVYQIMRKVGFEVKAAQYAEDGKATGHISKEERFEMLNMLFAPQLGPCRLYIEADAKGENEVAPQLVESLEAMERDENGKGETGPKNASDKSDLPAALGYALWPVEKPSVMTLNNFREREKERKALR